MFTSIIISLAAIFLIYEITILISPYKYDRQIRDISKDIQSGYLNPNYRPFLLFNFMYFGWSIMGLFTTYWPVFTTLILVGVVSSNISKRLQSDISRARHRMVDATTSILFLIILLWSYYL